MRNSFATKLLSIAMMLLFPAAMLVAETGNTVLYGSGNVMLNGKEVARSASVATGDKIETAGAAATAVSTDGSKVVVNAYSAVRYESAGVNVVKGAASISTTDGLPAQAAQITITPKDKAATYEIARLDNNIVITSHTGALMISDAGKTSELDAGGSSSRAADPTPAPGPAPQAFPVFPGSNLTGKQVFTIGAVVGGASLITGLWAGMAAASNAPLNAAQPGTAQARAVSSHQGRAMAHVVQVARIAATPVVNGARNSAQMRSVQAQHRGVRAVQAGR
ncbi:MAG TPA: hypothetical protein VE779_09190 [Candidatus Angelobacter sp.]|nr:hypothetical protein [Candidatus Angelobacter sp.]